jgi:hypothetical protein
MVASGTLAASASAATISVDKPCYVDGSAMIVTGAGFDPGDSIELSGGNVFGTAQVTSTGTFSVTTGAPTLTSSGPGTKTVIVTASDDTTSGATITASTPVMAANLAVTSKPAKVHHLTTKVTFTFSGFVASRHIYGHYLRRKKAIARATFGRAKGPCGTLTQKATLYPGAHPKYQTYTVAFDSSKKYSKKTRPQISGTLSIGTVF